MAEALLLLAAVVLLSTPGAAQSIVHQTVFVAPDSPLQAQAFDAGNWSFQAVPLWSDGQRAGCHLFRVHETLPPIDELFLPTSDGTLAGVPRGQQPLLARGHFTADAAVDPDYSDVRRLVLVEVPSGYQANSVTDADLLAAWPHNATDILVNAPLVPPSAVLRDLEGEVLPIDPLPAWLDDRVVHLMALEATDPAFAAWLDARTRTPRAGPEDMVRVLQDLQTAEPLRFTGAYPGARGEHAWPSGTEALLAADGYSALRDVHWVVRLPAVPEGAVPHPGSGDVATSGLYANCPQTSTGEGWPAGPPLLPREGDAATIARTGTTFIGAMDPERPEVRVDVLANGTVVASADTNEFGAFTTTVDGSGLPRETERLEAWIGERLVATWDVEPAEFRGPGLPTAGPAATLLLLAAIAVAARRRHP